MIFFIAPTLSDTVSISNGEGSRLTSCVSASDRLRSSIVLDRVFKIFSHQN